MKQITTQDIYEALQARQAERGAFNRWLGASVIGHHCRRYVAYSFRCAFHNNFGGVLLRVFENGHRAEDRIVADLEALGNVKVVERQKQLDLDGGLGHVGVTIDGVVVETHANCTVYLLLEMKTMNAKSWNELAKKGVREAQPKHYAQMQFGMRLTGLGASYYVAENKDTNELWIEHVVYNLDHAEALVRLSSSILAGNEQVRCSERPDWYECNRCSAKGICHGADFPRAHCLTCCHSTPSAGGKWTCARWDGAEIPRETLPKGCQEHIYLPWMVHLPVVGYGEYWVTYALPDGRRLCNTPQTSFPEIDGGEAPITLTSAAMESVGSAARLVEINTKGEAPK